MRIVIDTNNVISAVLQPMGPSASVFLLARHGVVEFCLTEPIAAEYEEVMHRPHLKFTSEIIAKTMASIREAGHFVKPVKGVHACTDPDDNMLLECAEAAEAHYLITGNTKDFPVKWKKTRIVTAREFLNTLTEILRNQ